MALYLGTLEPFAPNGIDLFPQPCVTPLPSSHTRFAKAVDHEASVAIRIRLAQCTKSYPQCRTPSGCEDVHGCLLFAVGVAQLVPIVYHSGRSGRLV